MHQESTYIKCCLTRPEFARSNSRALRRSLVLGSWDLRMVLSWSNSECRSVAMREGSLTPLIQLVQNCHCCSCWQGTLATDTKMCESHGGLLGISVVCLLYNQRVDQTPTGPTLASSRRLWPRGDHCFRWWEKVPYKPTGVGWNLAYRDPPTHRWFLLPKQGQLKVMRTGEAPVGWVCQTGENQSYVGWLLMMIFMTKVVFTVKLYWDL